MGCGWLGFPLGKSLSEEGYKVHGSTTSKNKLAKLEKAGIVPFMISLSENRIKGPISEFLTNVDILVINVPPKLRGTNTESYVKKMELVAKAVASSHVNKILFVSSTSVYGSVSGQVTEEDIPQPKTESGIQLLASENLFSSMVDIATTIVRFGGLIGADRHPINMLSGRTDLTNGNDPINLIHLEDCINIISSIIKNNWWNELFNAVYPYHPTKKEYYTAEAQKRNLAIPTYANNKLVTDKIIDSRRLIHVKKYVFKTPI